jgi:hypothetical protein
MIVQPEFLDHWKTRLLIELTGDESSPLAVIRLWSHCQTTKKSYWPDMTPAQLASVCRWGNRKPNCHTTLIKCGFVKKLSPKGFAAHEWDQYNAKLISNWENGKLGGRPPRPHKIKENEKPMVSVGLTQQKPIDRTEQIDLIKRTRTEGTGSGSGSGFNSSSSGSVQSSSDLASHLASQITSGVCLEGGVPTVRDVEIVMNAHVQGSGGFAQKWWDTMNRRGWTDNKGKAIHHWKPLAESFASGCIRQERGILKRPDRNAGTLNETYDVDAAKSKVR